MFTGRQALGSIDSTLQKAVNQVTEVEQRIELTSQQLLELEQGDIERFRELAQIRVDLLAAGDILQHLDESEQATARILDARTQAHEKLRGEIRESEKRQKELDTLRSAQLQRVDEAEAALDQGEADTQKSLEDDPAYQRQLEVAQQADRMAEHAEEKTALAQQDRQEKGKPYESDLLFMYLWKRKFGTSEYGANPLFRYLDQWVANLCGYGGARANYAMLTDIPRRLQEHSEDVRALADRELDRLEQREIKAAETDGIPALRQSLAIAQSALAEIDEKLAQQQTDHQELLRRNSEFAAGEDRYFKQAIEYLASELRRDDITTLHRDARLTPTPEDDIVIDRLISLRTEKENTEENLAQQRALLKTHRERVNELESLRLEFKRQRYDGRSSIFADGTLVGVMLSEFLKGVLNREGLWREIQRQHRNRTTHSNPDFGTGGFTRRRSTWGSGGGWGGFGGGGGGGGFKTGGGF